MKKPKRLTITRCDLPFCAGEKINDLICEYLTDKYGYYFESYDFEVKVKNIIKWEEQQ